jgi:hypothetical protein
VKLIAQGLKLLRVTNILTHSNFLHYYTTWVKAINMSFTKECHKNLDEFIVIKMDSHLVNREEKPCI